MLVFFHIKITSIKKKGTKMEQHSIIRSFLLYLFLSGLFFNGLFLDTYKAIASEKDQIAQSVTDEEDEEDDEDC